MVAGAVPLPAGAIVTATATALGNINTSEFAQNVAVPGAPPDVRGATYSSWTGFSAPSMSDIPLGTGGDVVVSVSRMESPSDRGDNLGHPPAGAS